MRTSFNAMPTYGGFLMSEPVWKVAEIGAWPQNGHDLAAGRTLLEPLAGWIDPNVSYRARRGGWESSASSYPSIEG
jgi:hypothetical protein